MQRTLARKNGSSPTNHGYLRLIVPARPLTPEQFLDRDMREICASCKIRKPSGTQGGYACRTVEDAAQGVSRFPLRVIGRLIANVILANGPEDFTDRICAALKEFKYRKMQQLGRGPSPVPPNTDNRLPKVA